MSDRPRLLLGFSGFAVYPIDPQHSRTRLIPGNKPETFVVDTSNILFICSGAFVGLESLVNSRLGKGVSHIRNHLYHS